MRPSRINVPLAVARILAALHLGASAAAALDPHRPLTQYAQSTWRVEDGLPQNNVHAIATDGAGYLWLGTESGLARFDGVRFTHWLSSNTPGILNNSVWVLLADRDGDLWVGTESGLFHLQAGRWRHYTTQDGLAFDVVWSLRVDRQKRLWAGTYGGGVSLFQDGRFQTYSTGQGLAHRFVYAIQEDRDGNLWFGTEKGLSRWRDGTFETITPKEGLAHDRIWCLHEDVEGSLWLGTRGGGGLVRLKDGLFRTYGLPEGLLGANIYAASADAEGNVWAAMLGAGVARIGRDGRVRNFTAVDGLQGDDRMWTVTVASDGKVWAGGDQRLYRLAGDRFVRESTLPQVRGLLQDRDGSLWIGTAGHGLARLQEGRVAATYAVKDGLASDSVKVITQDAAGDMWFGTTGGLSRLHQGRLETWTMKDGLLDDVIFQIFVDGHGYFWLGSTRGVFRVSRQDLEAGGVRPVPAVGYGTGDGLRVAACTGLGTPAGFRCVDGRLWFTTPKGLSTVDPPPPRASSWRPPLLIEEILVNGTPVSVSEAGALAGGVRELEVRYTALSLRAPERVRFKFWLEGFDRRWHDAGARRAAYYTNLPHGSYRFRVAALSNDGAWSDAEAALPFTVKPLFYQTAWFATLGLAATAGLAFQAHRFRLRQMRQREKLLAARVEEAVGRVKVLSGLLPICAHCKKIRDDGGYWNQIETYIRDRSHADFSHGICPECMRELYPEQAARMGPLKP